MVRLSTALAQFILAISYIWSISTLNSFPHKRFSISFYNFCIGALSAGLGVLRYGNPLVERSLAKADERVQSFVEVVYPTFVATEFLLLHWPESNEAKYFIQLIILTSVIATSFWLYENQSSRRNWNFLMKKSIRGPTYAVSLAMVVSLLHDNFQGTVASVFLILNAVFIGTTGSVFEMPARDLYSYTQCFCNYHVVRALMD